MKYELDRKSRKKFLDAVKRGDYTIIRQGKNTDYILAGRNARLIDSTQTVTEPNFVSGNYGEDNPARIIGEKQVPLVHTELIVGQVHKIGVIIRENTSSKTLGETFQYLRSHTLDLVQICEDLDLTKRPDNDY